MTSIEHEMSDTWEDAVRWLRGQPDMQALVRDAYYDDPLIEAAERFWQSEEWAETRRLIGTGNGRHVLDIGAGRGIASYALARDGWKVTALEPDASNLVGAGAIRSLSNEAGVSIEIEQRISETLPFENARFDLVYGRAVLHHIGDLQAATREFVRVLKPGGCLLAVREHVISRDEDREAFFKIHPLHWRYGGENAFPLSFYQSILTSAGLRIRQTLGPLQSPINFAPYTRMQLIDGIASRASVIPLGRGVMSLILRMPLLGDILLGLIQSFDNRPGRLYSFLAERT